MKDIEYFPDGKPIDDWFYQVESPKLEDLGKEYLVTDYGISDDGRLHTQEIQDLIDRIHMEGGGVLVIPYGTYRTGALFFKQGVHLHIQQGGILKGSDDIYDYPILPTRIEGENCTYFSALINADGLKKFVISGEGIIDGSGELSWRSFWLRKKWNASCTNKDEQRARLIYISHCTDVTVCGIHMQNSQFWTNHLYHCERVKYLNCKIFSPYAPIKAPSTDGIDIDVCKDVLIKNCHLSVADDAVVLKGGKGPWADTKAENGANERVLIEDCFFGECAACLTCGSESIYNRNVLMRRIQTENAGRLLWLKMRPDTPQCYEYITVEQVQGSLLYFLYITPWTQFYDLKDRKEIPISFASHIRLQNSRIVCTKFFNAVEEKTQYRLLDFYLKDLDIVAKENGFCERIIDGITVENVVVRLEDNGS